MNLLQRAISDIDYVLRTGRIILPEGSPTAEEHVELRNDFNLLVKQVQLVNELGKKITVLEKELKVLEGRLEETVIEKTEDDNTTESGQNKV